MTTQSLEYTNQQRKNGEGCDVWIVVDGMKIGGHKAVLSKKSPYFRNMFNTDMMEANMDEVSLSGIPGIDYETMDIIIGDMYGHRAKLTIDNSQSIILLANYMQLSDLVDRCAQFIIRQIDQTNCFSMKNLLKSTNCDNKLISKTDDYINAYFVPLSKHESFIELDIEDVTELLSSDKLYVESEIDVCEGGITWLNEKKEQSNEYCQRIFKCIRLSLLPSDYLSDKLSTYPLFQNDPYCRRMIEEIVTNRLTKDHETVQHKPRECHDVPLLLVRHTASRWYRQMHLSLDVFDIETTKWKIWKQSRQEICDACFVCHNRDIYVIGTPLSKLSSSFGKVNWDTGIFTSLPSYPGTSRASFGAVVGTKLYVMDHSSVNPLKIYDIKSCTWSGQRGPARNNRKGPETPIAAVGKHIYVFGEGTCVERFDTETIKWEYSKPRKHAQRYFSVAANRGKLYVAGGSSFEVYDPTTDQWTDLSTSYRCYDGLALVSSFDGIYAMSRHGQGIEHYDVNKDEWTVITLTNPFFEHQYKAIFAIKKRPYEL